MKSYYRPIVQNDALRPEGAVPLAGGWAWFDQAERLNRAGSEGLVSTSQIPAEVLNRLTAPRPPVAGASMDLPRLMGILNVTPDSFSDGGDFAGFDAARAQALRLVDEGADFLDVGGESTRPGAVFVPAKQEIARVVPVIEAMREVDVPISVDTRKADVAAASLKAGAAMLNDVSALGFDAGMASLAGKSEAPICLMHAQGDPKSMQDAPRYENVLLDVYDFLESRIEMAEAAGVLRARIVVDPGIGFGKTVAHNLALLAGLSLLHGLGCPVLLGASRKRFIGTIGGGEAAQDRMPGSVAVALAGFAQGVQILRVHDMQASRQAMRLWWAATGNEVGAV